MAHFPLVHTIPEWALLILIITTVSGIMLPVCQSPDLHVWISLQLMLKKEWRLLIFKLNLVYPEWHATQCLTLGQVIRDFCSVILQCQRYTVWSDTVPECNMLFSNRQSMINCLSAYLIKYSWDFNCQKLSCAVSFQHLRGKNIDEKHVNWSLLWFYFSALKRPQADLHDIFLDA